MPAGHLTPVFLSVYIIDSWGDAQAQQRTRSFQELDEFLIQQLT